MNEHELVAHDYITLFLDAAAQKRIDYMELLHGTEASLRSFRPRCPMRWSVVAITPWVDGLRAAKCGRCGHGWKEAPL
jgi:hypothetical protein